MRKQYHKREVNGHRHIWDVHRLIELSKSLKPKDIPLSEIQELDETFWYQENSQSPTCRSIAEHAKLVNEADLLYPIILSANGRVMDGIHRVCKALIKGKDTIETVQFDQDPEPDYIDVNLSDLPY